ncbi:hypothetical protein LTR78_003410 [Recurvomyces mirabilis]|uniref:Uncharacterized protein n=1 Tax=Recurvomyces mirabilis TaxID=574656 RepID=A0AAE0WRU9_9PEZI|nr:hypothetical protein LTR78_003410 [Recurvomyces mirabilis]KAK5154556.1 hypothetical protein LTS14_006693 [Recurvomyces mirabilis]
MADEESKDSSQSNQQPISEWSDTDSSASQPRSSQATSSRHEGGERDNSPCNDEDIESLLPRPTSALAAEPLQDLNSEVDPRSAAEHNPSTGPSGVGPLDSDESISTQEAATLREAHATRQHTTRNDPEPFPAFRDLLTSTDGANDGSRAPVQSPDSVARLTEASRVLAEELASATHRRSDGQDDFTLYSADSSNAAQRPSFPGGHDPLEPDNEFTVEDAERPTLTSAPRQAVAAGLRAQQNREPRQVRRVTGQHDLRSRSNTPTSNPSPGPPLHHPRPLPPRATLNPSLDPFHRSGYMPFPTPTQHTPPILTPGMQAAIASPESEHVDRQIRNLSQVRAGVSLDSSSEESSGESEGIVFDAVAANARFTDPGTNRPPVPPGRPANPVRPVSGEPPHYDDYTPALQEGRHPSPRPEASGSGYREYERIDFPSEASATRPWLPDDRDVGEPARGAQRRPVDEEARSGRSDRQRGLPAGTTSGQYLAGLLAGGPSTPGSSSVRSENQAYCDSFDSFTADVLGRPQGPRQQPQGSRDRDSDARRMPQQEGSDDPADRDSYLSFAEAGAIFRNQQNTQQEPEDPRGGNADEERVPQHGERPQRKFSIMDGMSPQATRHLPQIQRQLEELSLRLGELGMHSHILRRDGILQDESPRSPVPSPMELEGTENPTAHQAEPLNEPGPIGNSLPLNTNIDGTVPAAANARPPGPRDTPWVLRQLQGMRDIGLGLRGPRDEPPRRTRRQQQDAEPQSYPVRPENLQYNASVDPAARQPVDQWLNQVHRPAHDPLAARSELNRRYRRITAEVLDVLREMAGTLPGIRYQSANDHHALQRTIRILADAWRDAIQSYATVQAAEWDARPISRWHEIMESVNQDVQRLCVTAGYRTHASYGLEIDKMWDQARAERKARDEGSDTSLSDSWDTPLAKLKGQLERRSAKEVSGTSPKSEWLTRSKSITRKMKERAAEQRRRSPPSPQPRRRDRYYFMNWLRSSRRRRRRDQRQRDVAETAPAPEPQPSQEVPQHEILAFDPVTGMPAYFPNPAYARYVVEEAMRREDEEERERQRGLEIIESHGFTREPALPRDSEEDRLARFSTREEYRIPREEREAHFTPRAMREEQTHSDVVYSELPPPADQPESSAAASARGNGGTAPEEITYPTLPSEVAPAASVGGLAEVTYPTLPNELAATRSVGSLAEEATPQARQTLSTSPSAGLGTVRTSAEELIHPTLPLTSTPSPPSDNIFNPRRRGLQPLQTQLPTPSYAPRMPDVPSPTVPAASSRNASWFSIGPHNQRDRSGTISDLRSPFESRPSISGPSATPRRHASNPLLHSPQSNFPAQSENVRPRPSTSRIASGGRARVVSPSLQGRLSYYEALGSPVSPNTTVDRPRELSLQNTPVSYPNISPVLPAPGSLSPNIRAHWERLGLSDNYVRRSPGTVYGPRNPSLQGTGVGASSTPPSPEEAAAEQRARAEEVPVDVPNVREVERVGAKHDHVEENERREVRGDSLAKLVW